MAKSRRRKSESAIADSAPVPAEHGYPRPQLRRAHWTSLNGPWDFKIDFDGTLRTPQQVRWNGTINVPFSPETPASGIGDTDLYRACWYRRTFEAPELEDERLLLHFGAVDHIATVWVNGHLAAQHEGGYTPFTADITDLLVSGKEQNIVVRAEDDPHDLAKPRGKQDWKREPHSIWYPRTSGIWQTVWLERVPSSYIRRLRWTPTVARWEIALNAWIGGSPRNDLRLRVRLRVGERVLVEDVYGITDGEVLRVIQLNDPGIDDARNELFWWPWSPTLIEAQLELLTPDNHIIDTVESYTAMRTISTQGDRLVMNGRPMYLRLVLDQGYWPESGLTPPSDDALRRDVELVKAMGFNGVRKHQKIEDPRFLYWADKLGLMVWEEMPSAYRFDPITVRRKTREWLEVIERDISHPCIIAWVPLNESWSVPDLPDDPSQRDFVRSLFYLTKSLDRSRPVIGNDGWENIVSDIITIHDYDGDLDAIRKRYDRSEQNVRELFTYSRPGNKQLVLDSCATSNKPIMLTEFGGIAYARDTKGTWGYRRADTPRRLAQQYTALLETVRSLPVFSGFCYTQFTDTYQEANGLLFMDRTPKFPLEEISRATGG